MYVFAVQEILMFRPFAVALVCVTECLYGRRYLCAIKIGIMLVWVI